MNGKYVKVTKIIAKLASAIILLMFFAFFVGEGIANDFGILKTKELILILLIPGLVTIGTIIAWKKELIGGIIVCISVILFNIIEIISKEMISFDFAIFLIIGILFIIVGIYKKLRM